MLDKTARYTRLGYNSDGDIELTFTLSKTFKNEVLNAVNIMAQMALSGKDVLKLIVKLYRKARSLNANAYAWLLIGKIAEILKVDKEKIYLTMLQRYGVFTHIVVKPNLVDRVQEEWRTSKVLGEVTVNGQTGVQIQCYFGSSTYSTKEMSVLIDGIVSECKEMNIETETPEELARLKEEWGR